MDNRITFDKPELLVVLNYKSALPCVVGYVTALSLKDGVRAAIRSGIRCGFTVTPEVNLAEISERATHLDPPANAGEGRA